MLTSKVQLGYVLTGGGGQAVQCLDSLPPTPRTGVNQTDVGCKHLNLTEIMFTSLTTTYSKIMIQ